jgi:hypothetical protein
MSTGLDHIVSEETNEGVELSGNGYGTQLMNTIKETLDDKYFKRFIKSTERLVRTSIEYKEFVSYILSHLKTCAFFENITTEEATIEIHHHPLTLYEIVEIVAEKKFGEGVPITTFDVADEVLRLHWERKVGVIPLSKTVHELAHQGEVHINIDRVFGKVAEFVEEYEDGFTEDHIAKIEALITHAKENKPYSANDILRPTTQKLRLNIPQFSEFELSADSNGIILLNPNIPDDEIFTDEEEAD